MGAATVLPMAFSFIGIVYVVRALDPAQYGVYLLFVVILQFFGVLTDLGCATAIIREMHQCAPHRRDDLVNSVLSFAVVMLAAMSAVAVLARPLYARVYQNSELASLAFYLPPLLVASALGNLLFAVMRARHQYTRLATIRIVSSAVRLVLLFVLVIRLRLGIGGLILADFLALALSAAWAYAAVPLRRRWMLDRQLLTSTLRFGHPLFLNSLLYFAYNRVDVIMVGYMIHPAGVAAISVAQRIPQNLKLLLNTSYGSVFYPRMSELDGGGHHAQAEALLNMSLRLMGFLALGTAFVSVLFRDEITVFLFSERYLESAPAFAILAVALYFSVVGTILGHTLVASGNSSAPVKISLVTITTNVIGNLLMIPRFGFTGAAWATMLMGIVVLPVNLWFLRRSRYRVFGWDYLKPLAILLGLTVAVEMLGVAAVPLRLVFVGLFAPLCILVSQPLRRDLTQLVQQARATVADRLRTQGRAVKRSP